MCVLIGACFYCVCSRSRHRRSLCSAHNRRIFSTDNTVRSSGRRDTSSLPAPQENAYLCLSTILYAPTPTPHHHYITSHHSSISISLQGAVIHLLVALLLPLLANCQSEDKDPRGQLSLPNPRDCANRIRHTTFEGHNYFFSWEHEGTKDLKVIDRSSGGKQTCRALFFFGGPLSHI